MSNPGKKKSAPRLVRLFQPRFAELVQLGQKCQTVRPMPRRMPFPGQKISLRAWSGRPYRSKQRVLQESTIWLVSEVTIGASTVETGFGSHDPETFARADGFDSWEDLQKWFRSQHGIPFRGLLICWLGGGMRNWDVK